MRAPKRHSLNATSWIAAVTDRPVSVAFGLFLLGCSSSAIVGVINGIPLPGNHDQFSYLLAADTFASGRLSNPSHPMWRFFESFHVIHQPTYVSKYPPAQGLLLAFGQVVVGLPVLGVWISAGLLPVAVYWCAKQWVPTPWATVAGVMATVQWGGFSVWAQSYWGGNVAAIGGALVFGVLPSLVRAPRLRDGFLLGGGILILANSRPFEGLIATTVAAAYVIWGTHRNRLARAFLAKAGPGLALVVLVGGLGMGVYNLETTGDPLRLPYQVHEETYAMSSLVPGTTVTEPTHRHDLIRQYHKAEKASRDYTHTLTGFLNLGARKGAIQFLYFLGIFGVPAALALPGLLKGQPELRALFAAVVLVQGASFFTVGFPHYLAPVTAPIYVLLGGTLWHLHERRDRSRWALRGLKVTAILMASTAIARGVFAFVPTPSDNFAHQRADVEQQLKEIRGSDLVVVAYGASHHIDNEWVYNKADIDAAEVVWARDMGLEMNQPLIEYFQDRTIWRLTVGASGPRGPSGAPESTELLPYPGVTPAEPTNDSRKGELEADTSQGTSPGLAW